MKHTLLILAFLPSLGFAETITNGQTIDFLSASEDSELEYELSVPNRATHLEIVVQGGSGDVDLYVRADSRPTLTEYDCRPYYYGNTESCIFEVPQFSTYHITLRAYEDFAGVSLSVFYDPIDEDTDPRDETAPTDDIDQTAGATWSGFDSYYEDAIGQTGQALLDELHISAAFNHNRMSYSQVWDALRYTDEDEENPDNVILIYTGRSQSKQFTSSGNNHPDAWNREHSWPKSHGFPSRGDWAYTDIHHLRPTDASVNSARGNLDFDVGGTEISEAPGNYRDSDSFEPRDAVKGDVARMMFYMDVRYNGNDGTGTDDLVLVNFSQTRGGELGDLCTLYDWHVQDPVSEEEIRRHSRIVERQGNRNPFVDYPFWANEIWGQECD